jgi:hypothetical protein
VNDIEIEVFQNVLSPIARSEREPVFWGNKASFISFSFVKEHYALSDEKRNLF